MPQLVLERQAIREGKALFQASKEDGGYLGHAGGFQRFPREHFPQQRQMGRDDDMIILGDFGGVWNGSSEERERLNEKPFATLFVSGNHDTSSPT